ncbi:MAG: hypothetical protein LKF34_04075, partial [Acidaminococcaceae bacterium]|nr:hypothetical protein [Acidaminococcaceae bacterium]
LKNYLFDFCLVASPSKEGVRPAHPSGLLFSFQGSVASGDFYMIALDAYFCQDSFLKKLD